MMPIRSMDGNHIISQVALEPNTDAIISVVGYNRNKDVWGPDAEEWIPERWLKPTADSVIEANLPAVFANM